MIDFFDHIYTSLDNRCSVMARLGVYKLLRFIVRVSANVILPLYFKLTANNPSYRLNGCDKGNNRYIVTLTSFPARIDYVWLVIETIFRQTIKPDMLILWLSQKQFPTLSDVPNSLLGLQKRGLTIRIVPDDFRSHKKYYYCLEEFPEDHFISIDDDVFYDTHLVERLVNIHKVNPSAVIGNKAHRMKFDAKGTILPYSEWEQNTREDKDLFVVGAGGNFYPAHALDDMASDITLAMELTPTGDDIWLNAMARLHRTSIVRAPYYFIEQLPVLNPHDVTLRSINLVSSNDIQIKKLGDYLLKSRMENPFCKENQHE